MKKIECIQKNLNEINDSIELLKNVQGDLREQLAYALVLASGKDVHASDCATSNAPAYCPGKCDCDCCVAIK